MVINPPFITIIIVVCNQLLLISILTVMSDLCCKRNSEDIALFIPLQFPAFYMFIIVLVTLLCYVICLVV